MLVFFNLDGGGGKLSVGSFLIDFSYYNFPEAKMLPNPKDPELTSSGIIFFCRKGDGKLSGVVPKFSFSYNFLCPES